MKPHPTIITIIIKGKFTGKKGGSMAAIMTAMTGLTPYILVEQTDSEVMEAQEYYTHSSRSGYCHYPGQYHKAIHGGKDSRLLSGAGIHPCSEVC